MVSSDETPTRPLPPEATPSELIELAERVLRVDGAVSDFGLFLDARHARTLLALLRPESAERRIVARRVKARELKVGDLFSFIDPDYWHDLTRFTRLSVGERSYVAIKDGYIRNVGETEAGADDLDTEVTLVEIVPPRYVVQHDQDQQTIASLRRELAEARQAYDSVSRMGRG